jgi:F420-dependent hydroxymycolic acid dehydrogenase
MGFVFSHEQFAPAELIRLGREAEEADFDMMWSSDHFQPRQDDEGHAGVTCPTFRYHPSIVAQAFASLQTLYPGRICLGVDAGEAVNEMVATGTWGKYQERTGLERQWEAGDAVSTEDLRLALQHYRSFFKRLLSA